MKTQVNSDKSIKVSAAFIRFIDTETDRVLDRFAAQLTRVEVHLSDVNSKKTGGADKQCVVEARPAGLRPVSVTATAPTVNMAFAQALNKMRRSLTSIFGRLGRSSRHADPARTTAAKKPVSAKKKTAAKKIAAKKTAATAAAEAADRAGARKKGIYQARRKAWPVR